MNVPPQPMSPEERRRMVLRQMARITGYLQSARIERVLAVTFGLALEDANGKPDDDLIVSMAGETTSLAVLLAAQQQQLEGMTG